MLQEFSKRDTKTIKNGVKIMKIGKGFSYNGDTIEVMDNLIDFGEKVDYVMTSPPYNMRGHAHENYNNATSFNDDMSNEEYKEWILSLFERYYLLLNEGGIVLFNLNYMSSRKNEAFNTFEIIVEIAKKTGFSLIDQICWKKQTAQPLTEGRLSRIWENVWVFIKRDDWELFRERFKKHLAGKYNYIVAPNNDGTNDVNKACFSSSLVEQLLVLYDAQENHVVLDNFMGTHTTAIACEKLSLKWIGIELDKETFIYGCDRVHNYIGEYEKVDKYKTQTLFNLEEEEGEV